MSAADPLRSRHWQLDQGVQNRAFRGSPATLRGDQVMKDRAQFSQLFDLRLHRGKLMFRNRCGRPAGLISVHDAKQVAHGVHSEAELPRTPDEHQPTNSVWAVDAPVGRCALRLLQQADLLVEADGRDFDFGCARERADRHGLQGVADRKKGLDPLVARGCMVQPRRGTWIEGWSTGASATACGAPLRQVRCGTDAARVGRAAQWPFW